MNQKANAVLTIDLKFHFKRQITLKEVLHLALPALLAVVHYAARLHGGP